MCMYARVHVCVYMRVEACGPHQVSLSVVLHHAFLQNDLLVSPSSVQFSSEAIKPQKLTYLPVK